MRSTEAEGGAEAQLLSLESREEIRPSERPSRFGRVGRFSLARLPVADCFPVACRTQIDFRALRIELRNGSC